MAKTKIILEGPLHDRAVMREYAILAGKRSRLTMNALLEGFGIRGSRASSIELVPENSASSIDPLTFEHAGSGRATETGVKRDFDAIYEAVRYSGLELAITVLQLSGNKAYACYGPGSSLRDAGLRYAVAARGGDAHASAAHDVQKRINDAILKRMEDEPFMTDEVLYARLSGYYGKPGASEEALIGIFNSDDAFDASIIGVDEVIPDLEFENGMIEDTFPCLDMGLIDEARERIAEDPLYKIIMS